MSRFIRTTSTIGLVLLMIGLLAAPVAWAAWVGTDIIGQTPYVNGSFTESPAGQFNISGDGQDIWDNGDSFYFIVPEDPLNPGVAGLYTGDFNAIARLVSQQPGGDGWQKANIMARANMTPGSVQVNNSGTQDNGIAIQWRDDQDGGSGWHGTRISGSPNASGQPYWISLERSGNDFTARWAPDDGGVPGQWGFDQTHTANNMPASVYLGLGVTSHSAGNLTQVVFDNFDPNAPALPPIPPVPPFIPPPDAPTGGGAYDLGLGQYVGYMGLREVIDNGGIGNQDQARASILNGGGTIRDYTADLLDIWDSGGAGRFSVNNPFEVVVQGDRGLGGVDNISLLAQGTIRIPAGQGGWHTFGVNSDDGFTLQFPNSDFDTTVYGGGTETVNYENGRALTFFGGRGASDSLGQINLPEGNHPFWLAYHEGGGGAEVELFSQMGQHTGWNAGFQLVGSPTGLQLVPAFPELTWPSGVGNWNSTNWVGPNPPPPPDWPDAATKGVILGGQVTVAANEAALALDVKGGELILGGGNTLNVVQALTAAGQITMNADSTLTVGADSTIASLVTNGNATVGGTGDVSVSGSTFDGGGATGTFTKTGPGTLSLDNSGGTGVIGVQNMTFDVHEGTLFSRGAQPLGGTSPTTGVPAGIILSGGTLSVEGGPSVGNGIYETLFDAETVNGGDPRNNIEGYRTATLGPNDAHGILTTRLHYPGDGEFDARATALGSPGFDPNDGPTGGNDYSALWVTEFTPNDNGAWGFRFGNEDDNASMWLDTTGTVGVFDASDRFYDRGCCGGSGDQFTVALTAGTTYDLGIVMNDTGGGGNFSDMQFMAPSGTWTDLDPSQPAQAGLWSISVPGAINMTGTPITVTANSGLNAISEFPPAAFGDLTLNDATTLTTTGAPMTFQKIEVLGTGTLAADNHVTTTNVTGGASSRLIMDGGGTLVLDNTAGGFAANPAMTFEVAAGRMEAGSGTQPALGGSSQLTLSGGTASFGDAIGAPAGAPAGALGIWTFDGDNANDSSGNAYHGVKSAAGSYSTDVPAYLGGKSVNLNGNGYIVVETPGETAFDLDTLSVAFWAKEWPDGGWEPFISKRGEGGQGWQVRREGGSGDNIAWTLRGPGNDDWNVDTDWDQVGYEWRHFVATYGDGKRRLYQNGVLWGEEDRSGNINDTGSALVFSARDNSGNAGNPPDIGNHANVWLDDIYIYDFALTEAQIQGLLPARTPPNVSGVNVDVINPAAPSTLESASTSPLAFNNLTLADGTTLTTTGSSDMSFNSLAVLGPAGRQATLVTENDVTTPNYSDGGIATTLVKDGIGTLTLAKGGTLSAGATTFDVVRGTLATSEPNELGGAPDVILRGSTFQVSGATTLTPGLLLGEIAADWSFAPNPGDLGMQDRPWHGLTNVKSGNPLEWRDNRTFVYTGQFYDADGVFSFGENIDDNVSLWIDGNEVIRNQSWNTPTATGVLNAGMGPNADGWHDFEVRFSHGGGGAGAVAGNGWTTTKGFGLNVNGTTSNQGGDFPDSVIDPGDASLFRLRSVGPIDVQARLTVDNAPADALMGSIFFGTSPPNDETPLNLDGANFAHNTTRVITGDKANTILIDGSEDPNNNTVIMGTTQNWDSFPNFGGGADNFTTAFSGQFTPRASGTHNFHWDNDDRGLMYIDLDDSGTFENSERVAGYAWNSNGNVNLTANQAYSVIYMAQEFTGGQSVHWYFTEPGGSEQRVNPGDPAQGGLWSTPGELKTSTLQLITDSTANLRELVLVNGNLRITGGNQLSIEQASVSTATGGAVGLITETDTILTGSQGFNGNGQTVTITKGGPATLTVNRSGTGLENADFRVEQGTLHAFLPDPFGAAGTTVTLAGGTFKATGETVPGTIMPSALGQWTFDADNADDSSGNGYHGTEAGPVAYSSDTGIGSGRSLDLTGGNADVRVDTGGSQDVFDGGGAMTIAAWVKGWPGGWGPFICKHGEPNGWQMRRHGGNATLDWTTRGLTSSDFEGSTGVVSDGEWHQITMTYDGSTKTIYVDGLFDRSTGATGTIAASNEMMTFGSRHRGGTNFTDFFNGLLDDVYFYNQALDADQVVALFTGSTAGGTHVGPIDMTTTHIRVVADSTLHADTQESAAFGNLTYENGTMNVLGAPDGVSFTGGGVDPEARDFGLNNPMDVTVGAPPPYDGGGATATFTKTGAGNFTLAQGTTNHGGVSVNVNAGRLISGGAAQAANLKIGAGADVDTGVNDVTISDAGQFTAGSLKISGSGAPFDVGGDNMAAGPERLGVHGGTVTVRVGGMPGGLAYHVDASDAGTLWQDTGGTSAVTADGQLVARWDDKGASGLNVTQGGAGRQPTYQASVASLNNQPALWFFGGDTADADALSATNATGITGNDDRTVITVWADAEGTGQNFQHTFQMGDTTTNEAYGHSVSRGDNAGQVGNHYWGADHNATGSGGLGLANIAISTWDGDGGTGTNGLDSWWVNGNDEGDSDRGPLATGTDQFQVGSRLNPFTEGFRGSLAEILVFDKVLSAGEMDSVGGYLATKYGISSWVGSIDVQAINLPDTDVAVSASATLFSDTPTTATYGDLALGNGVTLDLTGAPDWISFDVVSGNATVNLMGPDHMEVRGGIRPGDSVGTLVVGGDMNVADGVVYEWELGPDGPDPDGKADHDLVEVGGTLTFDVGAAPEKWILELVDAGGEAHAWDKLYLFSGSPFETDPMDLSGDYLPYEIRYSSPDSAWWEFTDPADLEILRDATGLYLFGLQTVPEPGTLVLLALGGLGLLIYARRRRSRAA